MLGSTRTAWLWRFPIAASVTALAALHERGIPIGVVSNAAGQIESVLRRAGVCQVGEGDAVPVRCVVDSHVVGVAKPDPRIFAPALAALGCTAERVAYVGDSVTIDVAGARAAGLQPVLLDPTTTTSARTMPGSRPCMTSSPGGNDEIDGAPTGAPVRHRGARCPSGGPPGAARSISTSTTGVGSTWPPPARWCTVKQT